MGGEISAPGPTAGTGPGVAQATTSQDRSPQDGHGNPLEGAYQPAFGHQGPLPGGTLGHPPGTATKRATATGARMGAQGLQGALPSTPMIGYGGGYDPYQNQNTDPTIDRCIARMGVDKVCARSEIMKSLKWQQDVNGESAKIKTFQLEVGSLHNFQGFLMMWKGSTIVTIVHSIAKYFLLASTTMRYQGRYIGFIGDRLPNREPAPVMLLIDKGWGWVKKKVHTSLDDLAAAYAAPDTHGKLWSPPGGTGTEAELHVPRMLLLPAYFVQILRAPRKALQPQEVAEIFRREQNTETSEEGKAAYQLAIDWCLMASQAEQANKDSHVAFGLDAVTEQDQDPTLARWLETRLDMTLGPQDVHGAGPGPKPWPPAPTNLGGPALSADVITQAVGQGLALGYQQIIVPQQRGDAVGATGSGQGVGKTGETGYTSDDVCTVMTFSGVRDPVDCQEIWTIFAEKKHNVDVCRKYLMKGIQKYAWERRAMIDMGVYLEQETMKAIVDLKFNPGEGTA